MYNYTYEQYKAGERERREEAQRLYGTKDRKHSNKKRKRNQR